jgi:hypothetical protein
MRYVMVQESDEVRTFFDLGFRAILRTMLQAMLRTLVRAMALDGYLAKMSRKTRSPVIL